MFRVIGGATVFSCHGGHVEAVGVDLWDGPLWSETNGQPLRRRTRTQEENKRITACSKIVPSIPHTDLFQRAGGPHQLVDHVDGDPHEGGEADEVPHRDAPVGVRVVEQCQLWHLQEGADDDKLRRRRRVGEGFQSSSGISVCHTLLHTRRSNVPEVVTMANVSHTERWVDIY